SIGTLVEAAIARAADDRPRLALESRHPGVDDVRVSGLNLDVHRADAVVDEEHLLPGLAAIGGLEYAALLVPLEGIPIRRNPDDVRVGRVNADRADLAGIVKADK